MKHACAFLFIFINILIASFCNAQTIIQPQLDSIVNKALQTFNVPGIAVSIVKDGKVLCKGYGLRSLERSQKVDENTLFGIASCSKAFTAAALGILVDEDKLAWDDKLIKFIPEFKMYDSCVTKEFTIRDMLTHRSGLGLGAGDLLHNPDSSNFTIKDVINSLQYLKPEASFRNRYAYDNIFYLIAAEVVKRVSGISWQDFVETRIMQPLQMVNSRASYNRAKNNPDIIDGYKYVNVKPILFSRTTAELDAGAGGIYTSAADMSKWMLMQLNDGRYGRDTSQQLLSDSVHAEMWTPQIFIPATKYGAYNTHFGAYGLGWVLTDVKGFENVSHTGQDDGMISEVSLIPDINFGITVLSNAEGGGAVRAIVDQVVDSYIDVTGTDRIAQWSNKIKASSTPGDSTDKAIWNKVIQNKQIKNFLVDSSLYTGRYHDNWFGNVSIEETDGGLRFQAERSPQLRGNMFVYAKDTFLVRWDNPQIKADAFVNFIMTSKGTAKGFTIQRALPETSFAFDFQDLNFVKLDR